MRRPHLEAIARIIDSKLWRQWDETLEREPWRERTPWPKLATSYDNAMRIAEIVELNREE